LKLGHKAVINAHILFFIPFTDEEDLFMVCDLLTGGDLRYHLQNRVSSHSQLFPRCSSFLNSVLLIPFRWNSPSRVLPY